jgi:hypothetical protein
VTDAGFGEERRQIAAARALVAGHLAEEDGALRDVRDDAGRRELGADLGHGAHERRQVEHRASRLSFSTPFCSDSTVVSRPTTGAICRATARCRTTSP